MSADRAVDAAPGAPRARLVHNLVGALLGGLLIATIEFAITRASVEYSIAEQLGWLARLAVHWALSALPLGIAFTVAERRARDGLPSPSVYSIAVVAGATLGALVMALHGKYVDRAISEQALGFDLALPDRFLYGFWQLAFWGTVGAVLHASDLRRRRSAEALNAGEIARLRGETQLADARLAALHAQVEPQFLLATLGRIEQLYETDAAAADRVLDALIRFLREAIPALRRPHSTLAEECRLLREYLAVVGGELAASEPPNGDRPMPPGLLVSLAQVMIDHAPAHEPRFELQTDHTDRRVTLELSTAAGPATSDVALREAAAQASRRLALTPGSGGSVTVLHDRPGRHTLAIALVDLRGD